MSSCPSLQPAHPILPLATGVLLLTVGDVHLDAPWSATGTGTTNVTCDGSTGEPRFDYAVNADTGAWTFSTIAGARRRVPVGWSYGGFHAWLNVHVLLERFVQRSASEIVRKTLAEAGPAERWSAPSGGFAYVGTSTFDVQPGDVYGFLMSGSNFERPTVLGGAERRARGPRSPFAGS